MLSLINDKKQLAEKLHNPKKNENQKKKQQNAFLEYKPHYKRVAN